MTKQEKSQRDKIYDRLYKAHDKAGEAIQINQELQKFIDFLFQEQKENDLDFLEIETQKDLWRTLIGVTSYNSMAEEQAFWALCKILKLQENVK